MKARATFLLGCLWAANLIAAPSPGPAAFEIRRVLPVASPDSETMVFLLHRNDGGEPVEVKLFIQKKPLLEATALKSATVETNRIRGGIELDILFTDTGARRLAEITRDNLGERLAVVIDGQVVSAANVAAAIPGGRLSIPVRLSEKEARVLASRLGDAARE